MKYYPIIVFFDHSYVICFFSSRHQNHQSWRLDQECGGAYHEAGQRDTWLKCGWEILPREDHGKSHGKIIGPEMGKYGEKSSPKKWQSNLWAEYLGWVPQKKTSQCGSKWGFLAIRHPSNIQRKKELWQPEVSQQRDSKQDNFTHCAREDDVDGTNCWETFDPSAVEIQIESNQRHESPLRIPYLRAGFRSLRYILCPQGSAQFDWSGSQGCFGWGFALYMFRDQLDAFSGRECSFSA